MAIRISRERSVGQTDLGKKSFGYIWPGTLSFATVKHMSEVSSQFIADILRNR
jgi:hypothetical protein